MAVGAFWCAALAAFVKLPSAVFWTLAHVADAAHYLIFLGFLAACVVDPDGHRPLRHLLTGRSWLMRLVLLAVLPCALLYA
ncbi:hypothetical protein, partial [Vibrio cholerae]